MKKVFPKLVKDIFCPKIFGFSYFDFAIIYLAFSLGVYLNWTIIGSLFFVFTIAVILRPPTANKMAIISLVFMIVIPPLVISQKFDLAEQAGILVFYTLILTAILASIEYFKQQNNSKKKR